MLGDYIPSQKTVGSFNHLTISRSSFKPFCAYFFPTGIIVLRRLIEEFKIKNWQ